MKVNQNERATFIVICSQQCPLSKGTAIFHSLIHWTTALPLLPTDFHWLWIRIEVMKMWAHHSRSLWVRCGQNLTHQKYSLGPIIITFYFSQYLLSTTSTIVSLKNTFMESSSFKQTLNALWANALLCISYPRFWKSYWAKMNKLNHWKLPEGIPLGSD